MTENQPTPMAEGRRKAAVGFIFATAVMDILAIGIIIPVLPQLVRHFTGGDYASAAVYVGWFGLLFAAMQFIGSPIQGALSDRFGRRPVILISVFGLGFDYVLMALSPSLWWLFIGRAVSGLTSASFSTANAYVADITPPERRAAAFGLMGASFGIGFILGPALGGFLGRYDPRLPFWAAAGLAFLNGCYGLFVLPESLPKERRSALSWRKANPVGSFVLYRSHPELLGLAGVLFLFYLAHQVLQSTIVLYTGYRYGWDPQMVGWNMAAVGVNSILVQTLVVKRFVARFGERGALYAGLFSGAVGFAIFGLATNSIGYWSGLPIFAFMGLVGPGVQGLMTRMVKPTEQGRLQGANSGVMAMAGLIGPILFTRIFAASIHGVAGHTIPGAAPYVASALLVAGLLLALWVTRGREAVAEAA